MQTGELQAEAAGKAHTRAKTGETKPETKAHTLMTQSLTVDTANTILRVLPHLSPLGSQHV